MQLKDKIKKVSQSIVAIGFIPEPNKITIIGSGFSVSNDGKILSAAHLFKNLPEEKIKSLICMALIKRATLDHYRWFPVSLLKLKEDDDMALLKLENFKETLLKPLELDDSEKIQEGQEVYFIGYPYAAQLINEGFGVTLIVNKGIISSIKPKATEPHPIDWFIIDAISNPGNSGCPLINIETNKVIGVMSISFRTASRAEPNLDIREPMHIAGAKPINLAKTILE